MRRWGLLIFLILGLAILIKTVSSGYLGNRSSYSNRSIYVKAPNSTGYSYGGLITLSSLDEPSVNIGSYDDSGPATITIFKGSVDNVISLLTHNKENNQTQPNIDTSSLESVTQVNSQVTKGYDSATRVLLPLANTGIWVLKIDFKGQTTYSVISRSNYGVLARQGESNFIFWAQDLSSRRSMPNISLSIYSLTDSPKVLSTTTTDSDGIANAPLDATADIAIADSAGQTAIVPLNLQHLSRYAWRDSFGPKQPDYEYFVFTDRPLYLPGDTVYFKAIIRADDDRRYSIPQGMASIQVCKDGNCKEPVVEKSYAISPDGAVSGQFKLDPEKTGSYQLQVSVGEPNQFNWNSSAFFDVQYYRKPEYFLTVTSPKLEYVSQDKAIFTLSATYFSGQPVTGQKIKYSLSSTDSWDPSYLKELTNTTVRDYYGLREGPEISSGEVITDAAGQAQIELTLTSPKPIQQIFTLKAQIDNGSADPAFAYQNVLVYPAQFGIFRTDDYNHTPRLNAEYSLPLVLHNFRPQSTSSVSLQVDVIRKWWERHDSTESKYPTYTESTEKITSTTIKSDSTGQATFLFTPKETGSYEITVSASDSLQNTLSKKFYVWVSDLNYPAVTSGSYTGLTITFPQTKYYPTDSANAALYSEIPNRDIFLSLGRGRIHRYQVVKLTGNSGSVNLPLQTSDMPNISVNADSFSDVYLDQASASINLITDSRKINVSVTPDRQSYGPSDNVTLHLQTTDATGQPVSADTAVWAVDKALYELMDSNLGSIFDRFWSTTYTFNPNTHSFQGITVQLAEGGGGCFGPDTPILLPNGQTTPISRLHPGQSVATDATLTPAQITAVTQTSEPGYLLVNGDLKITPDHILFVNSRWQTASIIRPGSTLLESDNKPVMVTSVEYVASPLTVYNLSLDKKHTFFANGVFVHNQKGGGVRSVFKDTAYWNPSVTTNSAGQASVSFKLPDNLTTWVIAAVAASTKTQVGQATSEIQVTKDVIVRPFLPNLIRVGDKLTVSALVQNFSPEKLDFDVRFSENPTPTKITLEPRASKNVTWPFAPTAVNPDAKVTFSATSTNGKYSDSVVRELPIIKFGYFQTLSQTASSPQSFTLASVPGSDPTARKVTVSVAPSLLGTLPSAVDYLLSYPYGCVEQTTSRLFPLLIAKTYPDIYGPSLKDRSTEDMIKTGLSKLRNLQSPDGGWGWWYGASSPYVTAYVSEILSLAKAQNYTLDATMMSRLENYLLNTPPDQTYEQQILRSIGQSLLGIQPNKNLVVYEGNQSDLTAMIVMHNLRNGHTDPQTNGLNHLVAQAQTEGDSLFWSAGTSEHWGSAIASTSLAGRAILTSGGDRQLAVKAMKYLQSHRQFDYWVNTFGTVQAMRFLTQMLTTGQETTPSYTYSVSVDGKSLDQGKVTDYRQIIPPITFSSGSQLVVSQTGPGQIYTTVTQKDFITDAHLPAQSHGLSLTRKYVNAQGEQYSLAVGDNVLVHLTVSISTSEPPAYLVISDELPAGLVPINEQFKNSALGQTPDCSSYCREYTQNGILINVSRPSSGSTTYTYRARVASAGQFLTPPAKAELMYAPEFFAQTAATTVTTTAIRQTNPLIAAQKSAHSFFNQKNILKIGIGVLALCIIGIIIYLRKHVAKATPPPNQPLTP